MARDTQCLLYLGHKEQVLFISWSGPAEEKRGPCLASPEPVSAPSPCRPPPWRLQARTWVEARSKKEGRGLEKDGGHGLGV